MSINSFYSDIKVDKILQKYKKDSRLIKSAISKNKFILCLRSFRK